MKKKITIVDKDLNQLVVVADCSSALYQDRGTKLGEQNLLSCLLYTSPSPRDS